MLIIWRQPDRKMGLPRLCSGKESACQRRRCRRPGFDIWVGKIPWRRKWQLTSVFLPRKSHGQKSVAGYSPWGRKVSDTTKHTCTHTGKGKREKNVKNLEENAISQIRPLKQRSRAGLGHRTRRKNEVTLDQFVFFNYSMEKAEQSKSYRVKGVDKATFPFVLAKRPPSL